MAGSAVAITRESRDIGGAYDKEIKLFFEFTSDDTTGLCPTQDITGMGDYLVTEIVPNPDDTSPPDAAYEVRVENESGEGIILTGSISVSSKTPIGAHLVSPTGNYPRLDDLDTISIVDPADHSTLLDIGNSNVLTIMLRCESK